MESVRVRTRRVTSLILQSTTYPASVTTTTMASPDSSNTVLYAMMMHYKESMEKAIDAAEAAQRHAHEAIQEARLSEAQAQSEALALDAALEGARADADLFLQALRARNEHIDNLNIKARNVDSHNAQVSLYYKAQIGKSKNHIDNLRKDLFNMAHLLQSAYHTTDCADNQWLTQNIGWDIARANENIKKATGIENFLDDPRNARQSGDYTTTPRNSPAAKRCLFGDEVIDLTLDSDSDSDDEMDSGEETETDTEQ